MITFLDIGKYGRLGNQMFQIASTIGIAKKHGHEYGFQEWANQFMFKNKLPALKPDNYDQYFKTKVPFVFFDVKIPDNISLHGWNYFQSWKYFDHCRDLIRFYFDLAIEPKSLRVKENDVCVHIRRGDYQNIDRFNILGSDYYDEALRYFNGKIYVFADSLNYVKSIIKKKFIYVQNEYYVDFACMCKFRNFIIANSTFSWWPAWLFGEIVIAPKKWFNNELDSSDICPCGWKLI